MPPYLSPYLVRIPGLLRVVKRKPLDPFLNRGVSAIGASQNGVLNQYVTER